MGFSEHSQGSPEHSRGPQNIPRGPQQNPGVPRTIQGSPEHSQESQNIPGVPSTIQRSPEHSQGSPEQSRGSQSIPRGPQSIPGVPSTIQGSPEHSRGPQHIPGVPSTGTEAELVSWNTSRDGAIPLQCLLLFIPAPPGLPSRGAAPALISRCQILSLTGPCSDSQQGQLQSPTAPNRDLSLFQPIPVPKSSWTPQTCGEFPLCCFFSQRSSSEMGQGHPKVGLSPHPGLGQSLCYCAGLHKIHPCIWN
uniref:Uncharacterized protein n=1 Tax=Cyanistes caeruleus TaxID=156563 RepID=A0A8C0VLB0_CYACU